LEEGGSGVEAFGFTKSKGKLPRFRRKGERHKKEPKNFLGKENDTDAQPSTSMESAKAATREEK